MASGRVNLLWMKLCDFRTGYYVVAEALTEVGLRQILSRVAEALTALLSAPFC